MLHKIVRVAAIAGTTTLIAASGQVQGACEANAESALCKAQALSMVQKDASLVNAQRELEPAPPHPVEPPGNYSPGKAGCPCIGISFSEGRQNVHSVGEQVWFPAGVGTHCDKWEKDTHPSCEGENPPAWCARSWCFVDPCNCDLDGDEAPSKSAYFPDATFQGKELYYSYATCGGSEMNGMLQKEMPVVESKRGVKTLELCGSHADEKACTAQGSDCRWDSVSCRSKAASKAVDCSSEPSHDMQTFGESKCPCIGIDGLVGTITGVVKPEPPYGEQSFPAGIGGSCHPWDADLTRGNPGCDSDGTQPHWCLVKFCYVDPCNCEVPIPPKRSNYFVNATFKGKPLYYSYATCGNQYSNWESDNYSAYAEECINHNFPETCSALGDKCFWQDGKCLDMELKSICKHD